jgi:hypothetical protein
MARVARVIAMAMRVVGNKEGIGKGGKSNDNGNEGVRRWMAMAIKRAMATAMGVVGNKEGNGNKEDDGNSNKGGRQQRG